MILKYSYIGSNCYKTKRFEDKILEVSTNLSSVKASKFLGENIASVCKSSICNMIKKIKVTINKFKVKKICIDDFAIKKRHKYTTVLIDIDNHKIVDIIESRKNSDVSAWLKTFPNLELVSRYGAQCYRNAINETNKDIVQVTDRFHLLKNLTTYCKDFLLKKYN